jgi:hypothetical protein
VVEFTIKDPPQLKNQIRATTITTARTVNTVRRAFESSSTPLEK